jgi:hypothetical protein
VTIKSKWQDFIKALYELWMEELRYILFAFVVVILLCLVVKLIGDHAMAVADKAMWFVGGSGFMAGVSKLYSEFRG